MKSSLQLNASNPLTAAGSKGTASKKEEMKIHTRSIFTISLLMSLPDN